MNKTFRITGLIVALVVIAGIIVFIQSNKGPGADVSRTGDAVIESGLSQSEKAAQYPRAVKIVNPTGFINTKPLTIEEHIGEKVILVDFWTYSCINCQRTFPYLKSWWEEYEDDGLLIIGVHTPEFSFEEKRENVVKATEKYGISYPVVMDNNYATWRAYNNRYWPRKYLIDIDGYIVYDHIGEGAYDQTEEKIRELLQERADKLGETVSFDSSGSQPINVDTADHRQIGTPEIYFGASRNASYLGNGQTSSIGSQSLTIIDDIERNKVYLEGNWFFSQEYVENQSSNTHIVLEYLAKKVNIVAGSEEGVIMKIYNDGEFAKEIFVQDEDLYNIIDNEGYEWHKLEIIIEEPGAQVFTFTFG